MALRDLIFRIKATDETDETTDQIQSKTEGLFSGMLSAVGAVSAAIGQMFQNWSDEIDALEERYRNFRMATGSVSEIDQELLHDFIGMGLSEAAVTDAFGAVGGRGAPFGLTTQSAEVASFVYASELGVNASNIFRAGEAFGETSGSRLALQTEAVTSAALARDVDPGMLFSNLGTQGTIMAALGLNMVEGAEFVMDLEHQGIDPGGVMSALARLVGEASEQGQNPRAYAEAFFADVAGGDPEAVSRAEEQVGARGAVRLVEGLQSGDVGFGDALDIGYMAGLPTLAMLAQPTTAAQVEGRLDEQVAEAEARGGILGAIGAAAVGTVRDMQGVPILGAVADMALRPTLGGDELPGGDQYLTADIIDLLAGDDEPTPPLLPQRQTGPRAAPRPTEPDVDRTRAEEIQDQIEALLQAIQRRENLQEGLPTTIAYDPEKIAAMNLADRQKIGELTSTLAELGG